MIVLAPKSLSLIDPFHRSPDVLHFVRDLTVDEGGQRGEAEKELSHSSLGADGERQGGLALSIRLDLKPAPYAEG